MFLLPLLALSAAAIELDLSGECPGDMIVDVTSATPSGMVIVLLGSDGLGSDPIPTGPCVGISSGLAGLTAGTGLVVDWDLDGQHRFRPRIRADLCSAGVQVLDIGTCDLTRARTFGAPPVDLVDVYASYESDGRTVYFFQSDATVDLATYTSFCEERGMSWFTPRSADDAQQLIDQAFAYDEFHTWILTKSPIDGPASMFGGYVVIVDGPGGAIDSDGFTAVRKWSSSFCNPDDYGLTRCWDADHSYDWLVCES